MGVFSRRGFFGGLLAALAPWRAGARASGAVTPPAPAPVVPPPVPAGAASALYPPVDPLGRTFTAGRTISLGWTPASECTKPAPRAGPQTSPNQSYGPEGRRPPQPGQGFCGA